MERNLLSVVIITHDAASHIVPAVESAGFADEVLVVDSGSTDDTCRLAEQHGARVCHQDWLGFGPQKNRAIALATHTWVFVLDSDERITPALQEEIIATLRAPRCAGYFVPRLNYFWGKCIKTCGLYPDYSLRLFRKDRGQFNPVPVHEAVQLQGEVGTLEHPMQHLAYDSVEALVTKQRRYAKLSPKKSNRFKAVFAPVWTFIRVWLLGRGFLEGRDGWVIAKVYAQYTYWKYRR